MARIHVEVYGCSANQADSEMVQGLLGEAGHTLVGEPEAADASVVLTCTVKTPTERKLVKRIRWLSDLGGPLIVAGCMPEAQRGLVEETASGASMVGPDNLLDIVDVVEAAIEGRRVEALQGGALDRTCLPRIRRNPIIHIAPVASGCLGNCSYCIVRRARGRLNSFPAERIVDDVERALGEGCREIWVTAEDTAAYRDGEIGLPKLLEELTSLEGKFFIRVGMMNPNNALPILDDLIEAFGSEKVFKFLHVPVQSGNDQVLGRMRRRYSADDFRGLVRRFREAFPRLTLSTDMICGFPGESEGQFQDSLRLIEEIRPEVLNISRFWPRPGTDAEAMDGQLHGRETKDRSRRLSALWKKQSLEGSQRWVGWEGEILVDEVGKRGSMVGRNFAYKAVVVEGEVGLGEIIRIQVTEACGGYLSGTIV